MNKAHTQNYFDNNRKVSFMICGAQKCGTTVLDSYLREHPDICMAKIKETHFFDNENIYRKNNLDYAIYHSFFNPRSLDNLLGESTPIYMYWHDSPRRIWEYNSNMKIIAILRNPIDRAYSHWNMERDRKLEKLSFYKAIKYERERCREALPYQHRVYSYVDRGFYSEQLRRLLTYFPQNQILVLRNEDLKNQPQETLDKVCIFLNISLFRGIRFKNLHSRPYISEITNREREYLKFVFEYEIRCIERMLGWDCNNWLDQ